MPTPSAPPHFPFLSFVSVLKYKLCQVLTWALKSLVTCISHLPQVRSESRSLLPLPTLYFPAQARLSPGGSLLLHTSVHLQCKCNPSHLQSTAVVLVTFPFPPVASETLPALLPPKHSRQPAISQLGLKRLPPARSLRSVLRLSSPRSPLLSPPGQARPHVSVPSSPFHLSQPPACVWSRQDLLILQ